MLNMSDLHLKFLKQQQSELPHLPVPLLRNTIEKYLRSVKPFLTETEFKKTKHTVDQFYSPGKLGDILQHSLETKALQSLNWLSEWWLEVAYLKTRKPLPIYSNTGMIFSKLPILADLNQLQIASIYVAAVLSFKDMLHCNLLPTEYMGSHALDMSQYHKFFGSCRVSGEEKDYQILPNQKLSEHIIVAHNKNFFVVPVYGAHGMVLNQSQIHQQLRDVLLLSNQQSASHVGILTTENRKIWSTNRKLLIQADSKNLANLELIEQSLFLVCLDEACPHEGSEKRSYSMSGAALQMIHGGGSSVNSSNRWFDKTLQYIVCMDGTVGVSFEHSFGDPVSFMSDYVYKYCVKYGNNADPVIPANCVVKPHMLKFIVPWNMKEAILSASVNLNSSVSNLELYCFIFSDFGKQILRSFKIVPDSFIQIAIQLAFYRLHKTPGAQYESATTRKFLFGRTETIRSCTQEALNFVQLMLDPLVTGTEKAKALRIALEVHRNLAVEAGLGEGIDRHLLGLKVIAVENGLEIPEMFQDSGFTRSGHMRLSTSQVASAYKSYAFFSPLVADGYGCCYNPLPSVFYFSVSAFNECKETSAFTFSRALETSLIEMKNVLVEHKQNCTERKFNKL